MLKPRRDTVYAGGGSDEICGFSEGTSPFIPVQYPSLPEVLFYRPRAAQVRVKVRARWCVWEQDIRVNNPRDLIHLTPPPVKAQTLGVHEEVKGVNEGGAADPGPVLCIFMGVNSVSEGRARPCPLADPGSTQQHGGLSPLRR